MARYETLRSTLASPTADTCPLCAADFLLFIPTHAPGLKAVFNYYTSTVKVSAEGDVNVSDESLTGLGTTFNFLKTSMFGAITQLVQPPITHIASSDNISVQASMTEHGVTSTDPDLATATFEQYTADNAAVVEDDPYVPVKPARRKVEEDRPLKLTDLVPDVGYFIAGGLSGITSRTATAPLDRLKVYLIAQTGNAQEAIEAAKSGAAVQATKQSVKTLRNAVNDLWAAGGIKSLFAGMQLLSLAWISRRC